MWPFERKVVFVGVSTFLRVDEGIHPSQNHKCGVEVKVRGVGGEQGWVKSRVGEARAKRTRKLEMTE